MANPYRGEVEIEIGGTDRVLRFDMNALAELEGRLQTPITKLFEESSLGIRVIREALHVGITHKGNKRISVNQVGEWMSEQPERLSEWGSKIAEALQAALGVEQAEEADVRPLAPVSSGSTGVG